eukprot:scaffold2643_cov387-Prasinococcus_capsulatus_cf.AAC.3
MAGLPALAPVRLPPRLRQCGHGTGAPGLAAAAPVSDTVFWRECVAGALACAPHPPQPASGLRLPRSCGGGPRQEWPAASRRSAPASTRRPRGEAGGRSDAASGEGGEPVPRDGRAARASSWLAAVASTSRGVERSAGAAAPSRHPAPAKPRGERREGLACPRKGHLLGNGSAPHLPRTWSATTGGEECRGEATSRSRGEAMREVLFPTDIYGLLSRLLFS